MPDGEPVRQTLPFGSIIEIRIPYANGTGEKQEKRAFLLLCFCDIRPFETICPYGETEDRERKESCLNTKKIPKTYISGILELLARIELATSSLPRMCSTD